MTTIDPTALLALADAATPGERRAVNASDVTIRGGGAWKAVVSWGTVADADLIAALDPDTVRALVAAYVERDALRAEVERLRLLTSAEIVYVSSAALTEEVTALRAAVARMTGPEAVAAVAEAIKAPSFRTAEPWLPEAAAAVRAIAALGAP